jgi:hypothetical protein
MSENQTDRAARALEQRSGWYWNAHALTRMALRTLRPVRFQIALALLVFPALAIPSQATDALWALSQERSIWPGVGTQASALVFGLSLWFWSRAIFQSGRTSEDPGRFEKLERWTPIVLGTCPSLALAIGCLAAGHQATHSWPTMGITLGIVASIVSALVLVAVFLIGRRITTRALRRVARTIPTKRAPGVRGLSRSSVVYQVFKAWTGLDQLSGVSRAFVAWTIVAGVALILIGIYRPHWAIGLGPMGVLMLAGAVWSAIGAAVVGLADRLLRVPIVLIFLVVVTGMALFDLNDNHTLRRIPGSVAHPQAIDKDFAAWWANRPSRKLGERFPVVIVAAEGGGMRNAYLSAMALSHLRDTIAGFDEHVYAISGVSGGSVGGALYAALVREDELRKARSQPGITSFVEPARRVLSRDLLAPLLAGWFTGDTIARLVPFPIDAFDRARALERELERVFADETGSDVFEKGFYHLRPTPSATQISNVPNLLLNVTRVETGERWVVSHAGGWSQGLLCHDLSELEIGDIPLSTAAVLSARFPLVTPAARVDTPLGKVRLVDGGYFENSGLTSAHDVAMEILSSTRSDSAFAGLELYVLVLDYDGGVPREHAYALGETLSPMRAMVHARNARGEYALNLLRQQFKSLAGTGRHDLKVLTLRVDGRQEPLPLGWVLSGRAREQIEEQLGVIPGSAAQEVRDGNDGCRRTVGELIGATAR